MQKQLLFGILLSLILFIGVANAAPTAAFTANTTSGVDSQTIQFTDTTSYSALNIFDNNSFEANSPTITYSGAAILRSTTYAHTGSYSFRVNSTAESGDAFVGIRPTLQASRWTNNTSYYWEIWVYSPAGGDVLVDRYSIVNFNSQPSFATGKIDNVSGVHTLPAGTWTKLSGYGAAEAGWNTSQNSWLILRPEYVDATHYSTAKYLYYDDLLCVPVTFAWDFGDGGTSTELNPVHTYNAVGTFDVNLTVTRSDGSDTETKLDYIEVLDQVPVAELVANSTSGHVPLAVQFTDDSTNVPTSWQWSFGDGSANSTSQNPMHIYTEAGSYTVTLTATNTAGSNAISKVNYITVSPFTPPVADFTQNVTHGAIPVAVQFTDLSTNTPTSWAWNFGDGSANSTQQNPIHIYNAVGIYTVMLTAVNDDGSDTSIKVSRINAYSETYTGYPAALTDISPVAPGTISTDGTWSLIPSNTTKEFVFATNQSLGVAYWVLDGVELANTTGTNLSYTFTEPGYYNLSVFIENINGNSSMVEYHTRVSRAKATVHVVPNDDTNYNNLMNATLNLSTDGIFTWSVSPFTDSVGRGFYLVLFCLPFLFIWMQTGKLTIVTTLTLITGTLFIGYIPETFKAFIAIAIVLSFASAFYKLSRGP